MSSIHLTIINCCGHHRTSSTHVFCCSFVRISCATRRRDLLFRPSYCIRYDRCMNSKLAISILCIQPRSQMDIYRISFIKHQTHMFVRSRQEFRVNKFSITLRITTTEHTSGTLFSRFGWGIAHTARGAWCTLIVVCTKWPKTEPLTTIIIDRLVSLSSNLNRNIKTRAIKHIYDRDRIYSCCVVHLSQVRGLYFRSFYYACRLCWWLSNVC